MLKILVVTSNPVKVEAVSDAFVKFLNEPFQVESISSKQNSIFKNSYETLQGAITRVQAAKQAETDFEYYIGIESGIEYIDDNLFCYSWATVLHNNIYGKAKSVTYILPSKIKTAFEAGEELDSAIDRIYGKDNMIDTLTKGDLSRKKIITNAVTLAISSLEF